MLLQAVLFIVTGTSTFILASSGVEVVGYSQTDGTVEVVAIFGDIGPDAVGGPPFLARLEDVVGIEIDQQSLVKEGFVDSCANCPIVLDSLELIIGVRAETNADHYCP